MNKIINLFKAMANTFSFADIDDETAKLMGEMEAKVADLEWPMW